MRSQKIGLLLVNFKKAKHPNKNFLIGKNTYTILEPINCN